MLTAKLAQELGKKFGITWGNVGGVRVDETEPADFGEAEWINFGNRTSGRDGWSGCGADFGSFPNAQILSIEENKEN